MKKHVLIIGLALVTVGLILITSSISSAQAQNEFTVPLSDPAKRGKLKAHLNYGSITVKGTARKDVLVKYKQEDEGDDDDRHDHNNGKKSADGLKRVSGGGMDLEASELNNFVKVQSDSWNNKMNLEIEVPSGFDLEVHTYNDGDLVITNVQGAVELTNYNGEITALNISGSVVATTYNGEIKVTFDKVSEGSPMSFSTYNGDVDLTFPATLKASFKMKTEQGEIYTGFDMNITSSGPIQKKDAKSGAFKLIIDDWKKGDVNGGGPEVTIKNYNGDIYIRKK
jgi:putative adhesin